MTGPSSHLTWDELACVNRLGRPFAGCAAGEVIAPYPAEWRDDRALRLAATFEDIRHLLGNRPITINSAYRRADYNQAVGGARLSQHVAGRALDIRHATLAPRALYEAILALRRGGQIPLLGGLGRYASFTHIDVRETSRLAVW